MAEVGSGGHLCTNPLQQWAGLSDDWQLLGGEGEEEGAGHFSRCREQDAHAGLASSLPIPQLPRSPQQVPLLCTAPGSQVSHPLPSDARAPPGSLPEPLGVHLCVLGQASSTGPELSAPAPPSPGPPQDHLAPSRGSCLRFTQNGDAEAPPYFCRMASTTPSTSENQWKAGAMIPAPRAVEQNKWSSRPARSTWRGGRRRRSVVRCPSLLGCCPLSIGAEDQRSGRSGRGWEDAEATGAGTANWYIMSRGQATVLGVLTEGRKVMQAQKGRPGLCSWLTTLWKCLFSNYWLQVPVIMQQK